MAANKKIKWVAAAIKDNSPRGLKPREIRILTDREGMNLKGYLYTLLRRLLEHEVIVKDDQGRYYTAGTRGEIEDVNGPLVAGRYAFSKPL
jgi:hypothetical protein